MFASLTLCIQKTSKGILLQTGKTHSAAFHPGQKIQYFFENYNLTSLDMYDGLYQVLSIKPEGRVH